MDIYVEDVSLYQTGLFEIVGLQLYAQGDLINYIFSPLLNYNRMIEIPSQ